MKNNRTRAGPAPFSKILRSLMSEKELTVRKAASMAGVSSSTINDWRSGAMPEDYSAVKRLAKGMGISFSLLLTGEEDSRDQALLPSVTEVFADGGALFDGYAKITIQRLVPRRTEKS